MNEQTKSKKQSNTSVTNAKQYFTDLLMVEEFRSAEVVVEIVSLYCCMTSFVRISRWPKSSQVAFIITSVSRTSVTKKKDKHN